MGQPRVRRRRINDHKRRTATASFWNLSHDLTWTMAGVGMGVEEPFGGAGGGRCRLALRSFLFVAVLRLLRFSTSTHCPSPSPQTPTLTPTPSSHITMSATRQFFVGGNFKVCPPDHQSLARPARLFAPPHHGRRQAERSCTVFALPPHRLLSAPDGIP